MSDILVLQMPAFKKAYKKLHANQKNIVNDAVKIIIENSEIGVEKKGDLSGVFIYKFKLLRQAFLLAYEWDIK